MTDQVNPPPTAATSLPDQVEAALSGLGNTADEVADRLRALGIKGIRDDAACCPIARLLESALGAGIAVCVGNFSITILGPLGPGGLGFEIEDAPDAVREFISRFDDSVYLDLAEAPA
jgi:hypothetical protein